MKAITLLLETNLEKDANMEEKLDQALAELKLVKAQLKSIVEMLDLHRAEHGFGTSAAQGIAPGGTQGGPMQPQNPGLGGMSQGQQQWGQGNPYQQGGGPGQFPGGGPGGDGYGAPPGM